MIGLWPTVDPKAEASYNWSAYSYVNNNPISNIDPTGMWTETADSYTTRDPEEIAAAMRQLNAGQNSAQDDDQKKSDTNKDTPQKNRVLPKIGDQVKEPYNGFWDYAEDFLFGNTYTDEWGCEWRVDYNGKILGLPPLSGIAPSPAIGKIGAYKDLIKLTKGFKGAIQAHHLVEARHLKQLGISVKDAPAVIVEKSTHRNLTNALRSQMPFGQKYQYTKSEIINASQQVYKDPAWINIVKLLLGY